MLSKLIIVAVVVGISAPAAFAAPPTKRVEQKINRAEVRQDKRELRNDRADMIRLQALHAAYKKARAEGNIPALKRLDKRTMTELRVEKAESRGEMRRDAAEIKRDKGEIRRDKVVVRRNVIKGKPVKTAASMTRLRDDKRDLRDDKRDLRKEVKTQARRHRIQRNFKTYMGKMDPKSLAAKQALIKEMMNMAKVEVKRDKAEIREDKVEIREDRRDILRKKK